MERDAAYIACNVKQRYDGNGIRASGAKKLTDNAIVDSRFTATRPGDIANKMHRFDYRIGQIDGNGWLNGSAMLPSAHVKYESCILLEILRCVTTVR